MGLPEDCPNAPQRIIPVDETRMIATAIPPEQWGAFADEFTRQHRGWLVTVEVTDTGLLDLGPRQAEIAAVVLARDRPLREVAVEHADGGDPLAILVGEEPYRLVHRIRRPLAVWFETTDDGAHQGLEIDGADGTTTLVRFRTPAHPEVIDGISEAEW
jgi:hypothetical protein